MSSSQNTVPGYGICSLQNPKRLLRCHAFFFVVGDIRYNNFSFILEGTEVAQLVKNPPVMQVDPGLIPGLERSSGERNKLPTPVFLGFPGGSDGKESTCNAEDLGWIPGLGRFPGGNGYPLQYSCLENPRGQRSLVGYGLQGCIRVGHN